MLENIEHIRADSKCSNFMATTEKMVYQIAQNVSRLFVYSFLLTLLLHFLFSSPFLVFPYYKLPSRFYKSMHIFEINWKKEFIGNCCYQIEIDCNLWKCIWYCSSVVQFLFWYLQPKRANNSIRQEKTRVEKYEAKLDVNARLSLYTFTHLFVDQHQH